MIQLPSVALFIDYIGGVYVYTVRLADALSKLGHPVHIVSYYTESKEDEAKLEPLQRATPLMHFIPREKAPYHDLTKIANAFCETQCNLFIPNFRGVAFGACALLSRTKNIRSIAVVHNDHSSYYNLFRRYQSILDSYVSPVESTIHHLEELFPDRKNDMIHIGHGIPQFQTCEDFSGGTLNISYHGKTSDDQKKIFRLLDLAISLKSKEIPHKFFIIGEGNEYNELLRRIDEKGMGDYFDVRPFLASYKELMERVQTCHIEVLTSEFEGFCLSLAESMEIGLPGIAMECGGVIEEYLHHEENGFVVPQGNIEEMAKKIAMLQKNPEMWKKMSEAARHEIQSRYSLELFGKKYSELLIRLADSDKPFRHWSAIRPVIVTEESLRSRVVEKIGQKLRFW